MAQAVSTVGRAMQDGQLQLADVTPGLVAEAMYTQVSPDINFMGQRLPVQLTCLCLRLIDL